MMMAKQESTELVPLEQWQIAALSEETLRELREANMESDQMSGVRDLPTVTVPTGGAPFWTVGDAPVKALEGIIVYQWLGRRYYAHGLDEKDAERSPPSCASDDMVTGHGDPGGECAACPYAQWGTGKGADGDRGSQSCKTYRYMVMQTPGSILQTLIPAPPTSLKAMTQYVRGLTAIGKPVHRVVTRLSLRSETRGANKTAVITPERAADVPDDFHAVHIAPLVNRYRRLIKGA